MMSDLPLTSQVTYINIEFEVEMIEMSNDLLLSRLLYEKCEKFAAVVFFFLSSVVFVGVVCVTSGLRRKESTKKQTNLD